MRAPDLALLLCLALISDAVRAERWQSEAGASSLRFTTRFEGAEAPGAFRRFEVHLDFGEAGPGDESLRVDVDITSMDLFSADLNEGAADPEWFDIAAYPAARFESHDIQQLSASDFVVSGNLQLKGFDRPVRLPFTWESTGRNASMRGSVILQRGDFGIGSGQWAEETAIAQDVRVEFDVSLTRQD
jgi:polyisoprenoid-binding protein YceI